MSVDVTHTLQIISDGSRKVRFRTLNMSVDARHNFLDSSLVSDLMPKEILGFGFMQQSITQQPNVSPPNKSDGAVSILGRRDGWCGRPESRTAREGHLAGEDIFSYSISIFLHSGVWHRGV